ncbi:unnamed protein product [Sphagnum jensenii]|uniref:Protein kinase domain-containing protein n=1 Tax=Sphagnum jensenii TaxID=128206 RepID=A0ABP1BS65_9BRYO
MMATQQAGGSGHHSGSRVSVSVSVSSVSSSIGGGGGGSVVGVGGHVLLDSAHITGKRGKVESMLHEVETTCWKWLVSNAWILVILLVFSSMEARGELQRFTPSVAVQRIIGAFSVMSSLISLAFIFAVGVSTGFWWRTQQQQPKSTENLQSPKLLQQMEETPANNSSSDTNSVYSPRMIFSPKASGMNNVGNLVQQYSLKEIVNMTNNFKTVLGRGGQGIVYAAMLPGDPQIPAAVKKLQRNDAGIVVNTNKPVQQTLEKEFWAELRTISRLHHGNLVALLGYCVEGQELFLIYEKMSNGSLDHHLHKWESGAPGANFLDWRTRMRAAIDVAQGLEYLHRHAHPTLVHRDIKSSNILFDDDMQAKIADFGLSKALIVGHDPTASHRVRGTPGYVDPSYLKTGRPVDKNDVYSFGVLLLELITGRRALQQKVSLVTWCREFFTNDPSLQQVLLPRMVDSGIMQSEYSLEQLQNVVRVARACVDDKQERRPSMKEVVIALNNADCKELSSSEFSFEGDVFQWNNGGSNILNNIPSFPLDLQSPRSFRKGPSSYEIKQNTIIVRAMVDNLKIAMRCKIWPTPKNFGLNKIEVTLNGAFLWKKGLWWYNARSSREFTVDDNIKLIAEWHVALRTSRYGLAPSDPRRSQGPFCVEYLALKDVDGKALVEYHGDHSPLPPSNKVTDDLLQHSPASMRQLSSLGIREPATPAARRFRKSMNWHSPRSPSVNPSMI